MAGEYSGLYSGLISNRRGYSVPNYNDGAPYAVPASIQGANEKAHEAASSYYDLMNSNSDEATNGRYQELSQRLKEVESEISQLEQEIARQKTLRSLEVSNDPYWELAKERYVRTGDMGELNNIVNRKMSRDMLEAQKAAAADEKSSAKAEADKREKTKNDQAIEIAIQDYSDAVDAYDIAFGRNANSAETKNAERKMNVSKLQLKHAYENAGRLDEYEGVLSSITPKGLTPKGSGSDGKQDPTSASRSISEIDTDIGLVKRRTSKSSSVLSKDKKDLEKFYDEKIVALKSSGDDYTAAENEKKKDLDEIDKKIANVKTTEGNLSKARAATEKSYKDKDDRDNAYKNLPEGVRALLNKSYDKATGKYRLVLKRSN